MGLRKQLKAQAMGLSQRALQKLFEDEKRATQLANAIGAVQRGKQSIDSTQQAIMKQLNFASRADYKAVGKALSSTRKKAQALFEKLSKLDARGD